MALNTMFRNVAENAFNIFSSMALDVNYVVVVDDGINPKTETLYPVRMIPTTLSEKEIKNLSFKNMIQPTDSIALITGKSIPVDIESSNLIRTATEEFTIIATDIDPAKALWIILLRRA